MIIDIATVAIIGFLLGSIPSGILLAKMFGLPDPRTIGSGNIGATNMLRTGNKQVAALTLIIDACKAGFAVGVALVSAPELGGLALLCAIAGHVFCPWLGFKGGKGVACAIGGLFILGPITGFVTSAIWLTIFFSTRISSMSAIIALLLAPFVLWWETGVVHAIMMMVAVALILYRHKDNIDRIIRAEEPRFEFSSETEDDAQEDTRE